MMLTRSSGKRDISPRIKPAIPRIFAWIVWASRPA